MILFIVRCCTRHERRYNKIIILLRCETDRSFQHRKISRCFLHRFFQKTTF